MEALAQDSKSAIFPKKVIKHRWYELDIMRFAAAMMVVAYHYCFFNQFNVHDVNVYYPELLWTRYGYLGVNLFFFISGFVILMSADGKTAREFVASRAGRLYPAFWVSCTLTAVTLYLLGDPASLREYLGNMTMMGKWLGLKDVDGVYWTLFVEMRFYVLIFLLLVVGRIHRASLACGIWLALSTVNYVHPIPVLQNAIILMWAPAFTVGCMFYKISSGSRAPFHYVLLGWAILLAHLYEVTHMGFVQSVAGVPFTVTALVSFEVVSVGLFVLIVKGVIAPYVPKWAYAVGALTYPLYLTHDVMGHAIFRELGGRVDRWALLGICVAAFLALSWAIYRFVERPLSPIIRRGLSHRTRRTVVDAGKGAAGSEGLAVASQ
jgi:peptidoglycan/LPS O-acetylase OafA/YrhL